MVMRRLRIAEDKRDVMLEVMDRLVLAGIELPFDRIKVHLFLEYSVCLGAGMGPNQAEPG